MDFPYGTTVTVRTTTTTRDPYGDSTTEVVEEGWGPVAIVPRTSDARSDSRAPAVITGLTILGPARMLNADDVVVIPSGHFYAGEWQLEGIPGDYDHPMTGWHPGIEVAVKRASEV